MKPAAPRPTALPARRRRAVRPGVRVPVALAASVLAATALAGCGGDDDAAQDPAAAAAAVAADGDATPDERLQAVVDGLPDMSEETYDQVGVVAELPDGVLADDAVADDVASFGDEESGWFVLERRAGSVEENTEAAVGRLTGAGFVEGEAFDPEGMAELRVFERADDGAVVGIAVSDVTDQSADSADFPTRIGYLVTPEADG
ncbi:hypothetical protein RDV89_07020 [Nocardioides zeae]|uniref:Secreted protein n=1 Tax=Nocardioides imazamoxiresistens TaxID=3231893 RepID=A0ABU3PVG4_9ACTN|nr:hypothetical protein [Nocardioides zeae]MDT9592812.1 hypothetical protein [Nocardioides zeae]